MLKIQISCSLCKKKKGKEMVIQRLMTNGTGLTLVINNSEYKCCYR